VTIAGGLAVGDTGAAGGLAEAAADDGGAAETPEVRR
jgi:hypothetical protein